MRHCFIYLSHEMWLLYAHNAMPWKISIAHLQKSHAHTHTTHIINTHTHTHQKKQIKTYMLGCQRSQGVNGVWMPWVQIYGFLQQVYTLFEQWLVVVVVRAFDFPKDRLCVCVFVDSVYVYLCVSHLVIASCLYMFVCVYILYAYVYAYTLGGLSSFTLASQHTNRQSVCLNLAS
jgi:hypothetical protein